MEAYRQIDRCRVSGSRNLVPVLNLGHQELTGVFPRDAGQQVTSGPLELVWCPDSGLLQLKHSYDPSEMYGENYGYRSGLNQSMVNHLTDKVRYLERLVPLHAGDVVLDIGSNDATTLKAYTAPGICAASASIPTGAKFRELLPRRHPRSSRTSSRRDAYRSVDGQARTHRHVDRDVLRPRGSRSSSCGRSPRSSPTTASGIFEQSYMPSMLRMNSYDTICHEHLEYYSLGAS